MRRLIEGGVYSCKYGIFYITVRTPLTAVHAQLNKKLRMNKFLTITTWETRVFLQNHALDRVSTSFSGRYFIKRLGEYICTLTQKIANNPVVLEQRMVDNPSVEILF